MSVINLFLNKILCAAFGTLPSGPPPSYPSMSHLNYVKNLGSGLDPLPPFGTMSHISGFFWRHPLLRFQIFQRSWLLFLVCHYKEVYPVIEGLAGAKWECRFGILYKDVPRCNFWLMTPDKPTTHHDKHILTSSLIKNPLASNSWV